MQGNQAIRYLDWCVRLEGNKDQATKALMHSDPELFAELLGRLAQISAQFLRVQVAAGASAVQLFDSWVGAVSLRDYLLHIQPASAAVLTAVRELAPEVPRIHFGVGTGELLAAMGAAGATAVGVDFRLELDEAASRLGSLHNTLAVQGNLDPAMLFAPWPVLERRIDLILQQARTAYGHVFNLGHGVPPAADPAVLARVVDAVHAGPSPA